MTSIISWGQYVFPSNLFQPPGNSLRAIDLAFASGYDGIELDVQLSKSDDLVLMHDHTLDRTTYGQGPASEQTVQELATLELKDPWNGTPCYVETLTKALARVSDRGLVMVDMHYATTRSVAAVARSVEAANFDAANLLLLTYTNEGGRIYKETFPGATVLLKAPFNVVPPELCLSILEQAVGLDGVLLPLIDFPDDLRRFREATLDRGWKLAVYMHKTGADDLYRLMEARVDYVTSYSPFGIGAAKRKWKAAQSPT